MLQKKIKEGTGYMQESIAETMGLLVYFIVNKVGSMGNEGAENDTSESRVSKIAESQAQQRELMEQHFFKMPFGLLEKSPNKSVQHGASLVLSKVI